LNSFVENIKCDKQEKINPRLTYQRNFQVTVGFHTLFLNANFLINFKVFNQFQDHYCISQEISYQKKISKYGDFSKSYEMKTR